jgi:hypothetical protein
MVMVVMDDGFLFSIEMWKNRENGWSWSLWTLV